MTMRTDLSPGLGARQPASPPGGPATAGQRFASTSALARRHSVLLACAATLAVHLLSLSRALGSDEGGFEMVARHWHDGGPFLYGPQWVDRPPGLIALFDAAGHLGPYGVRITAAALAVVLVAALAQAARAIGGAPAARWAAWAGFAFGSSLLLGAQQLNGELAAATFVALSVAALLQALRVATTTTQTVALGALAGGSATVAVLMKQNFVDAFVFAAVMLTLAVATRANRLLHRPGTVLAVAGAFIAGAVVPGAATVAWAHHHGHVGALTYAMFGFRSDASAVMADWSWAAPRHRLVLLVVLSVLSGLLVLLLHLSVSHRRRLRHLEPLPWAVATTVAVELFGIAGGENFWPHYLIALIPMVALAAGLSVNPRTPGSRLTRRLVVAAAVVTAAGSPVAATASQSDRPYAVGRWVAAAAHPTDTIVVPFTHPGVIAASGLKPGYPYSWSLPVRTLDPHLDLLTSTLTGPTAPTWVVQWDPLRTWHLDADGQVDTALHTHYRAVDRVCGHTVWLHDGVSRDVAATPSQSACHEGRP